MNKLQKLTAAAIAFGAFAVSFPAGAVPAKRTPITVTQPDGTILTVIQRGDERSHQTFTSDGYLLIENTKGIYEYAAIDADGKMSASGIVARDADKRGADALNFLKTITPELTDRAISVARQSAPERIVSRAAAMSRTEGMMRGPGMNPTTFPSTGKIKGLVLLVEFPDVKFNSRNSGDNKYAAIGHENAAGYFKGLLNETDFDAYGRIGSARQWFLLNSNGQFEPEFDVFGPVTLPKNMAYYGGNDTYGNDKAPWDMVMEACSMLDDEIDFSQYDCDGDGEVDNIYVFYAGYGEADSQVKNTVWPHSYELGHLYSESKRRFDNVLINHYACSNETDYETKRADGMGTFVHEFSHVLGLPDLYATDRSSSFTPGEFSVLDYGPYNDEGFTPPNYSTYERYALGWLTPKTFDKSGDYEIENLSESNVAYIIPTEKEREYYLIENRQLTGNDTYIPGHGMLVWHVDFDPTIFNANTVNNTPNHQYVDLIEADNMKTIVSRSGDTFPGAKGVTKFDFSTRPSLRSWANRSLGFSFSDIREEDGVLKFHMEVENGSVVSGITGVAADDSFITVTGNIVTVSATADVYDMAGRHVAALSSGESVELASGLYIVVNSGNKVKLAL